MKTVFLYAGQGSQVCGMGKDLYETYPTYQKVIDEVSVGFDLKGLMHGEDFETLSQTEFTQPCMAAFAAGVTEVLRENGICADAVAGLSLGEYGALYAAGVFDAKTYVELTAFRGKAMAEAAKGKECSMSAILGMEASVIEAVCEEVCKSYSMKDEVGCEGAMSEGKNVPFVTLVNYNCPGQYVICGDEEAVSQAEALLKEKGAKRCVRLKVSGPFHTKYMKPAAEKLHEKFESLDFAQPQIPVALNVTGKLYDGERSIKELLEQQVQNGVHFEESIRELLQNGTEEFVEIGPGNTLSGFVKKIAKAEGAEVNIVTINTAEDVKNYIDKRNNETSANM